MGSFGSRATSLGGAAVMQAAAALRERLLTRAAEELEASVGDLAIEGDSVVVRGSSRSRVPLSRLLGSDGLEEEAVFETESMSFPYGLHLAALEVDLDTGGIQVERYAVAYDVGRAINP